MRLINIYTFQLHNFFTSEVPPYVVLSHRWQEEESSLQEYREFVESFPEATPFPGIQKILDFCYKARYWLDSCGRGVEWAWADTVCIDKTSNAELSEAINSMYRWYRNSSVCFVLLHDVHDAHDKAIDSALSSSEWFTRGWTLQELIAPKDILFYSSAWAKIGTRSALRRIISATTGIPSDVFTNAHPSSYSAAQRMAWAAMRQTTREEDIAYCLLGLFDVNIELLYGEGAHRAFRRLQMKILEEFDDETLFTWQMSEDESHEAKARILITDANDQRLTYNGILTGILALTPRQFLGNNCISDTWYYKPSGPIKVSSWGVKMRRPVRTKTGARVWARATSSDTTSEIWVVLDGPPILVPLACRAANESSGSWIIVTRDPTARHEDVFCRIAVANEHQGAIVSAFRGWGQTVAEKQFYVRKDWPAPDMVKLALIGEGILLTKPEPNEERPKSSGGV